jgi:hypothetical protein
VPFFGPLKIIFRLVGELVLQQLEDEPQPVGYDLERRLVIASRHVPETQRDARRSGQAFVSGLNSRCVSVPHLSHRNFAERSSPTLGLRSSKRISVLQPGQTTIGPGLGLSIVMAILK